MKPIVGMVAHEALPEPLLGLLSDIFSRARPVAFERGSGAPMHAVVVASRTLLASAPARVPLAVWADNADDVDALVGVAAVQAILSSVRSVVARAGAKGVEVPAAPRPMPRRPAGRPGSARPRSPRARAHGACSRGSRRCGNEFMVRTAPARKAREIPRSRAHLSLWRAVTSPCARWHGVRRS